MHFAATHDYSKVNETMRVIMDAATEIERLRKAAKEAAQFLRDEAENLKQAHTIGGVWDTSCEGEVIAHYESVMELVERLDSSNAVVNEEVGELNKELLQLTYEPHKVKPEGVHTEAVQSAAMTLRFLASMGRYEFRECVQHSQAVAIGGGAL